MKLAAYPLWLENWWVDRACRRYGVTKLEDCAANVRDAIRSLSDSFKVNHKQFPDYQRDPDFVLAYGLFYFPQSFMRIQFPLMEILNSGWTPPEDRPLRILDLGCGVGAAGFGAVSLLRASSSEIHNARPNVPAPYIEGWAVDHSEEALKIHKDLSGSFGMWQQRCVDLHHPRISGLPKMDLILLSFALTEMTPDFERSLDFWLRKLDPKGALLVLEPFSKPGKRRLEQYRDRLNTEKKYRVLASFSGQQSRTWNLPESMRLLNRNFNRIIDELNFTFLAITPEMSPASDEFVLITPFSRTKGKWIASGRSFRGVDQEYEILTRQVTPEMKRKLQSLKPGDRVRVSKVQSAGMSFRFEDLE